MKTIKKLWKNAGFANIGLAIAAIILFLFGGGTEFFRTIGFCLLSACIALNWQALMQKTTIDEDVVRIVNQVKEEAKKAYEEKLLEIKKLIIGINDKK